MVKRKQKIQWSQTTRVLPPTLICLGHLSILFGSGCLLLFNRGLMSEDPNRSPRSHSSLVLTISLPHAQGSQPLFPKEPRGPSATQLFPASPTRACPLVSLCPTQGQPPSPSYVWPGSRRGHRNENQALPRAGGARSDPGCRLVPLRTPESRNRSICLNVPHSPGAPRAMC